MSTSVKASAKTALVYLLVTIGVALFGAVYEWFSHGIYSYYMLYAFGFPLLLGALPFTLLALWERYPNFPLARKLYHAGVATATVGSIFEGILAIYGTSSVYLWVYVIAAAVLFAAAPIAALISRFQSK